MNARVIEETNTRIELRGRLAEDENYNWLKYSTYIDGELICEINAYPHSPLYDVYIMRLLEATGNIGSIREDWKAIASLPDIPDEPENVDEIGDEEYSKHLDAVYDALSSIKPHAKNAADKIDSFIDAMDKLAGKGVGESILLHDDENFTFFNIAFKPIFDAYYKARNKKTDKFRAKLA